MGAKVRQRVTHDGRPRGWAVWCPACDVAHPFDARWVYNGDHEAPSFTPSLKLWHPGPDGRDVVSCHAVLTAGVWAYCQDSGHAYAGKSLPAPDWPAAHADYGGTRAV